MRKYILLILAFALMSVGAKAAYAEEKPKALEFAQAVGIISREKQADDFITREELRKAISISLQTEHRKIPESQRVLPMFSAAVRLIWLTRQVL